MFSRRFISKSVNLFSTIKQTFKSKITKQITNSLVKTSRFSFACKKTDDNSHSHTHDHSHGEHAHSHDHEHSHDEHHQHSHGECAYEADHASHHLSRCKWAPQACVRQPAPHFEGTTWWDGKFKNIDIHDFRGKWIVLFFYPLDFTFVCPTEIVQFSDMSADFAKHSKF